MCKIGQIAIHLWTSEHATEIMLVHRHLMIRIKQLLMLLLGLLTIHAHIHIHAKIHVIETSGVIKDTTAIH